jgi:type IV secretory pathway VirB2 component (pilin)
MPHLARIKLPFPARLAISSTFAKSALMVLSFLILAPLAAHAQGSPFDTGFNAIQSLFTGAIAKVASLVAIVIGGYGFAHGEPGAKKSIAVEQFIKNKALRSASIASAGRLIM